MSKLKWDQTGERLYETGVDKVVLFPMESTGQYGAGVAWNGITAVNESPSGAEPTALYANNGKYLNLISNEDFAATIEAYTYPDEFEECDGSKEIAPGVVIGQQKRKVFGLAYRSLIGNDVDGNDHGYKLHLVYGCLAAPSEHGHATVNDSPEAGTMSWSVSTTPVEVADSKPTATVTIDSTKADKTKLKKLEDMLYGTDEAESKLPLPAEVITLMKDAAA
ncbi:MAG: hypothetical protein ACLT50_01065 [Mediterraneibacter faecis]|jgi:hypothetical protein